MPQSVRRALAILEALARYPEGVGISDLARDVDLPNSTVHRILATLRTGGHVAQDPISETYSLGLGIVVLARRKLNGMPLRDLCLPALTELRDSTGETAHLVVLESNLAICVASVESVKEMRLCSPVGGLNPLTCTAVGKVLLAHGPAALLEAELCNPPHARTEYSITDQEALLVELEAVRRDGVAFDREEHERGVVCIAAPVYGPQDRVLAAVGLSAPAPRVDATSCGRLTTGVRAAADRLSRECLALAVER